MHAVDAPPIPSLSDCDFYHTMDLPDVGEIKGYWDLRGRFDDYTGHVSLARRTVLDVGTASGFLSFEAERNGAIVTSFDADSPSRYEYVFGETSQYVDDLAFERRRNSYALAHGKFSSKAKLVLGDVYDLPRYMTAHDVVLVGQILVHLRDPLKAIRQAASVTKETLIIVEGSFESEAPTAVFLGSKNFYAWWDLSTGFYRHWLPLLGFEISSMRPQRFKCLHDDTPGDVEVWTIVATRTASDGR
jgi:SAM-dependent methyltransferase